MRTCSAVITVATGRHGTRQFPVQRVEQYTTSQAIDNDADSFSIDLGDSGNDLALCLERDNELRVSLFLSDLLGNPTQIFKGIGDLANKGSDYILSIEGRDEPSSLAVDSDALPIRKKLIDPRAWITQQAHALGISSVKCASMSTINRYYTDGSEKEWATWYRIARMRGMYMWTDNVGSLIIDKLGYSLTPTYRFGVQPRGKSNAGWIAVEDAPQTSAKSTRLHRVLVYGMSGGKKGAKKRQASALVAQGIDTSIGAWRKQPTTILTSTTAKTQADLKKQADEEVFESIVGAQEIELTIRDTGFLIEQNKMALVNLPDYDINMEMWFVVGVQRQGGPSGEIQIVRLREKGFALSKRVPTAPTLINPKDSAENKPSAGITAALAQNPNIRWPDAFVRATNEFGVPNGWDFAVFLGTLLSICSIETSFRNIRGTVAGAINDVEWLPFDQWLNSPAVIGRSTPEAQLEVLYQQTFANERKNIWNPRYPSSNDAVGPMQLVSDEPRTWADQYGWNDVEKDGEYDGGRWNPESNIRAAARWLVVKLKASPPADPTNASSIWIGVQRYGDSPGYSDKVKKQYATIFGSAATSAVASVKSIPTGSATYRFSIPGHGDLSLPANAPSEVAKAVTWAMARLGDPYQWGGYGPYYDCSSFVTAALASAGADLRKLLDEPNAQEHRHGESTYTLWAKGTAVRKDVLLPGDLVFFRGVPPEHVGMYIGEGLFIHDPRAGESVKISSLGEDYYRIRYSGARRYVTTWVVGGHD